MSIPKELEQAYENGYRQFSWVKEINENVDSLRTSFEKGKKTFKGERFYWQTPDSNFTLVGFGKEKELAHDQASFEQVDTFILGEKDKIYQNHSIPGTGAILFGGFAFDSKQSKQNDWGIMEQGLFYLPTFLLTETAGKQYLTLNFSAENKEIVQQKWLELTSQFAKVMATQLIEKKETMQIKAEEIAVSEWLTVVDETVAKLREAGPLEKVVLARRMEVKSDRPFQADIILKNLQQQQTNTYFFVFEADEHVFIGATPERLLKASKKTFSTASIAGSVSRGTTETEDDALGNYLLNDMKNKQEHKIVVDRIIKELEKMTGTSIETKKPELLKNRDIQHLHLPIEGQRQKAYQFLKGIQQLHPTPALGGEPKELALAWLKEHEQLDRGLYGAPIGWVAIKEDVGEFAVGIRSAVFSEKIGYLYAGCGIVKNSQAEQERIETKIKFQPMLRGIGGDDHGKSK
ncbi:menaquinone-specific isochorismate synthase [Enterococcus sp. DIV0840]|uniref:isochorismate synthase n=1 Tax=unclassified Enterococcus TaxID=2608891 RepID=UPI001A8C6859|nr:isochorismate synthase [Enterococcus sp. DIV0849a]MBO0434310.1 isochorismate synthase [Enterococcus sp. DIV0849a]